MEEASSTITLFGGIKGLIRDGDALEKYLFEFKPEVILVSLSEEHIIGLKDFLENPYEVQLSDYEIIYGVRLSVYGEVMTPPPIYIETVKYATSNNVTLIPLDMNEDTYSGLYTSSMRSMDLVRHSIRKRRLLKRDLKDRTPEEFVRNWERAINKVSGLRIIDEHRLAFIDEKIGSALAQFAGKSIFIVVDYEFVDRVQKFLESSGTRFTRVFPVN
ncbi:MAG: hypothetical protein QW597_02545 [Thermoplasmataceae archaeon]